MVNKLNLIVELTWRSYVTAAGPGLQDFGWLSGVEGHCVGGRANL